MRIFMLRSSYHTLASPTSSEDSLGGIRKKLARAMIGSTVDLLADSTIAHGVVAGVSMAAGKPKIVVNGRLYDMDQVITSTAVSIP